MNRLFRDLVISALAIASGAVVAAQTTAVDAARFESEIRKFDEVDRAAAPIAGGVVFTGSSSIRLWTTMAKDFPGIRAINRGFGGSEIPDASHYVDRLVIRTSRLKSSSIRETTIWRAAGALRRLRPTTRGSSMPSMRNCRTHGS